jgi:Mrp family chromosome partitioning ATPase
MSRNYEILRQTGKEGALFGTAANEDTPVELKRRAEGLDDRSREEILKLVQRIFLSSAVGVPRVVVFSGVERFNGCTWVCARTAEVLASQVRTPVCVVDGNVRFPALSRQFSLNGSRKFADSAPLREIARKLDGVNLWVVPSYLFSAAHRIFLNSDRLQARLVELKSEFSFVLIDTPPVNSFADAAVLGRMSDGVVLVLEANATRRDSARRAKENLESASVQVLGAVLNKRTYPIPNTLYHKL